MAVAHLLSRLTARYSRTRAFLAEEHQAQAAVAAGGGDPLVSRRGIAALAQAVYPSTCKILPTLLRDSQAKGSGFVVGHREAADGALEALVVTNSHVAGLTVGIEVVLYDGRCLPGKLVGRDMEGLDIALVAVALPPGAAPLPEVRLGDSDCLLPGDYAVAIGNPGDLDNIVTMGVVSGLIRPVGGGSISTAAALPKQNSEAARRSGHDACKMLDRSVSYIVTDAKVAPGMSGGPLLDWQGRVIGVNTFLRPDLAGMAFSIAINRVVEAIEDIKLRADAADVSHMSVWLLNDAMNTKARVSAVLQNVAELSAEESERVMMEAHVKGAAPVVTLPKAEAEALVEKILQADVLAEARAATSSKTRSSLGA